MALRLGGMQITYVPGKSRHPETSPMFGRFVPAVSPDELKFAAGVCMAAALQKAPYPNPTEFGFKVFDNDIGEVVRVSPTDNPLSRGMLAVCQQFDDGANAVALMMRIAGFMRLIKDERMRPYIRGDGSPRDGDMMDIRDEVLEVAAIANMSSKTGFNAKDFFRMVRARVVAHDREHQE